MTLNPHVGDHGYWLLLVQGSDNTTVDWAELVPELLVCRPFAQGGVFKAAPENLNLDRVKKTLHWRPVAGDLSVDGTYTLQFSDARPGGERRVLLTLPLPVDPALRLPTS